MKNINKSFYIISFLIALILLGTYFYLNQSDSDENISISEKNVEVEKIISKKTEQTSDNPKISEDQNNHADTDEVEESQPKEIRIVAEEILNPDEYDFGESMNSVFVAAGKPVKIDVSYLTNVSEGEKFQLEFNNIVIDGIVENTKIFHFSEDETDEDIGEASVIMFSGKIDIDLETTLHNTVSGHITYDANGVVDAKLLIDSKQGEYQFDIYKNIGYYIEEYARQREVHDRGIKID